MAIETSSFTKLDESERHCAHAHGALARNEGGKKNARKGVRQGAKTPGEIGSLKVVRAGPPDYLISLMDS